MSRTAIVVGNPKPRSRTYLAALNVVRALTGAAPDVAVDLAGFGGALLDPDATSVTASIAAVQASDLVVVASPTYRGSYSGLLKLYLDRIGTLAGVTAVPLMLGGDLRHSLACDVLLKPILVELGATCPTQGLFLVDKAFADEAASAPWLAASRRQVDAVVGRLR